MRRLILCANCLQPEGWSAVVEAVIDAEPTRAEIDLCPTCSTALLVGDFGALAEAQADERMIRRPLVSA